MREHARVYVLRDSNLYIQQKLLVDTSFVPNIAGLLREKERIVFTTLRCNCSILMRLFTNIQLWPLVIILKHYIGSHISYQIDL